MKTGIGVIGCSKRIKMLLSRLLGRDESVEIRGLRDPDTDRIKQFKEELAPNARVYETDAEIAGADDIDWIAVGSWNSLHAEQAITAFEAGKHVFCEKPLATNFGDCLAIKKAYEKSKSKLMIGFTLRYTWQYRKIRELIENGEIGTIISFEFNETLDFNHGGHIMSCWRRKREITGCHILEKCCHDLDLANWMVGSRVKRVGSFGGLDFFKPENQHRMDELPPDEEGHRAYCAWPSAQGGNPFTTDKDIVDNQVCIMEYENSVRATFHTNLNAGIPERRMYILGTTGAIRADLCEGEIELRKIGFNEKSQVFSGEHKGGHGGGDSVLVNYWSKMIHEDVPALTDLETGIESAVVSFAIDEARRKGRIVDLSKYWSRLDQSGGC
jgi:predicted dehydrogenase